jgi:zinc/manganese transport system permease protein
MTIVFFPMIACIALVGIHVYFGSFILRRGIIFVDLALAQWAALGYVVGHLFDVHHPFLLFILAFGFTVIPAFLLAL